MTGRAFDLDDVTLRLLDDYLMSDKAPENSMGLSDLDGFLTAVAIGPDLIMPSEWLPVVWGGEEPEFNDMDEANAILSAIMARYNRILTEVDRGADHVAPVYYETREGHLIAGDWAEGFMDGVRLRPQDWAALLNDPDARMLMMPILGLCSDEEGRNLIDLDEDTERKLMTDAPELIPECIVAIRDYWKGHAPPAAQAPRRAPKIGRNDPCPCGSGRKYKRCCGAN